VSLRRVWIGSPNYSARNSGVRLVVLHTAEGARNYRDLGAFFANPASGVSSHTGIDDTPGEIGEYVHRDKKAWTQANANPYSVAAELCAFAAWDTNEWHRHPVMLENAAAWVAEECAAFGIPIRQSTEHGVCQHVDLGAAGGNHWDCGPGFPMNEVLAMAGGQAPATPQPLPEGSVEMDSLVLEDGTIVSHFRTPDNHYIEVTRKAGTQGQGMTEQNTSVIDLTAKWSEFKAAG
jgi:hypothetical protein